MSSNLECNFIEPAAGQWFYVLQSSFDEEGAWSWRENASAYGPFASEDAAHEHLHDNHANPGGYSTIRHPEFKMDAIWQRLIDEAPQHTDPHRLVKYR